MSNERAEEIRTLGTSKVPKGFWRTDAVDVVLRGGIARTIYEISSKGTLYISAPIELLETLASNHLHGYVPSDGLRLSNLPCPDGKPVTFKGVKSLGQIVSENGDGYFFTRPEDFSRVESYRDGNI